MPVRRNAKKKKGFPYFYPSGNRVSPYVRRVYLENLAKAKKKKK